MRACATLGKPSLSATNDIVEHVFSQKTRGVFHKTNRAVVFIVLSIFRLKNKETVLHAGAFRFVRVLFVVDFEIETKF